MKLILTKVVILCVLLASFEAWASYRVKPMSFDIAPNDRKPKRLHITSHSSANLYLSIELVQILNKGHYLSDKWSRLHDAVVAFNKSDWQNLVVTLKSDKGDNKTAVDNMVSNLSSQLKVLGQWLASEKSSAQIEGALVDDVILGLSKLRDIFTARVNADKRYKSLQDNIMLMHSLLHTADEDDVLLVEEPIPQAQLRQHPLITSKKVQLKPNQLRVVSIFNMLPKNINYDHNYKIKITTLRGKMQMPVNKDPNTLSIKLGVDINYHLPFNVRASKPQYKISYNYYPNSRLLRIRNDSNSVVHILGAEYCNLTKKECLSSIDGMVNKQYRGTSLFTYLENKNKSELIRLVYKTAQDNKSIYIRLGKISDRLR